MDDLDRLIQAFRARAAATAVAKLDVLMDIEGLDDRRVVPFLLEVLANPNESSQVRIYLLKRLRNGRLSARTRPLVASVMMQIASDESYHELQLEAALALCEFTDICGVPALLGSLALNLGLSIDLRYSALKSLERAGPTEECVDILRALSADETLGRTAQSLLFGWHVDRG